jgi:hypothetical protein
MDNTWRGLTPGKSSEQDVRKALGDPDDEDRGRTYGSITDLHLLDYGRLRTSIFLKDGTIRVIVNRPKEGDESPLTAGEWIDQFGKPSLKLPSREGKNCWVYVYGKKGLAATFDKDRLINVERFKPIDDQEYEKTLYRVPPTFIK